MKKDKEWLKGLINEEGTVVDMNSLGRHDGQYWKNENIKINKGRLFYLIDQLDESQKQVVPQFVADWIETSRYAEYHLLGAVYDGSYSEDMKEWLFRGDKRTRQDNQDKLTRAWLDGYEVEKGPQWVVKDDTGYLSYLRFSIPDIYEIETSPDKNDAYKFNSKSKADLIADLVNGTAEEVTE